MSIRRLFREFFFQNELARNAWLRRVLADLPKGWRLLDAGAGELKNRTFCRHLEYISQDFAQYDGRGDSQGLHTGIWDTSKIDVVSDITAIPLPDNSFDAILCSEVFEHLPDPLLALKEFVRLLRRGGVLILTAPFLSLTHFAPYYYYSGFSVYFYKKHLEEMGFEILEMSVNGCYQEVIAQEILRNLVSEVKTTSGWPWRVAKGIILGLALLPAFLVLRILAWIHPDASLACFGVHVKARKK